MFASQDAACGQLVFATCRGKLDCQPHVAYNNVARGMCLQCTTCTRLHQHMFELQDIVGAGESMQAAALKSALA